MSASAPPVTFLVRQRAALGNKGLEAMRQWFGPGECRRLIYDLLRDAAYSGDPERPIRSIVNTWSADPEHAPDLA